MVSKTVRKSSTKSGAKNAGEPGVLEPKKAQAALARHLLDAVLPGDTPFEGESLPEVSNFLFKAASKRAANRSSLALESVTDERRILRIAIINDDMPFLVDSISATIAEQGLTIDRLVHPVVPVRRNADGELIALNLDAEEGDARESMIYIETPRVDAKQRRAIERALRVTLGDVRAAVTDWPKLRATLEADSERMDNREESALLAWLHDGMLTQLGHVTRERNGQQSKALGVCRKSVKQVLAESSFELAFDWFDQKDADDEARDLLIIKANHVSNVHRRIPFDLFIVGIRDQVEGAVSALSIHVGIWTSAALAAPPNEVPVLRESLASLTNALGFHPGGHADKALAHAFTALPHDLLIGFSNTANARLATTMMSLVDRPRPRLALIGSQLDRHIYAFVWLPRDLVSTQTRLQIQGLLSLNDGVEVLDWSLEVEGGTLAMLEFVLDVRTATEMPDETELEARLQDMLRGWNEAVENALAESLERGRAAAIAARFADAFPPQYRARYDAAEAARDIERLRGLATGNDNERDARFYCLAKDTENRLRLKIYQKEGALFLTDAVPALENFGFRVIKEIPVALNEGAMGTIHEFTLDLPEGCKSGDLIDRASEIEPAVAEVLNGCAESDPFNRLVIATALSAREADWLRAIYRYLRQTGMSFTIYTVVDALAGAEGVTRAMLDGLIARHDPGFMGDRTETVTDAEARYARSLSKVSAINDDRLLRLYHGVIGAILRTNAFAPAAEEALAFKLDSGLVPGLPKPVPWREIFVYSRRVEGIHLRAGAIARGGLRWSDRRDDFRTEILGLMKAQRVKNAVIVPTGAKGGFYPKQLPSPTKDRKAWAAEGQASYEVFIRTLLSVTDNIVDGKVVHPDCVVIHDGEDPYFVVAADKGTAKFSDVANGIAQAQDFWLDDAFASGGSNGYDHKAMGITARGAWVSVQRHFLEMGTDVQSDSITVAGCGDMSGDVFGNGMLLSKAIKLVAAFDHRDIFIDPDPDPDASWKERKRLFDQPSSSWQDYDPGLISKGGGVYSRNSKSIKLPKKARQLLGIEPSEIDPEKLIQAILEAPVDLLWFGGIGTYIKAASENDADVGDPSNDPVRISAGDVRAKAIGEGANLGITQAGRIEFALNGGRINADFIDNSAGVDCSDNEVNIKIALAAAQRDGKLSGKKRNTLLEDMTDEVSEIVLEDNRLQALALSIAEAGGAESTASYARLIETFEDIGELDRETEGLATGEVYARRASEGHGLVRPELAVLLSSAKLVLQDAIETSPLSQDAAMEPTLIGLFPEPMQKKFVKQIRDHQLRRELVATELANRIINRLGLLPPFELAEEEGATFGAVANAFVAADRLFDTQSLWQKIDQSDMPEAARIALFEYVAIAMRGHMADLLRAGVAKQAPADVVEELRGGIEELDMAAESLLGGESRDQSDSLQQELTTQGAPDALARRVAHLFEMDGSVGLAKLARDAGVAAVDLTDAFTSLGQRLGLGWAQGTAAMMDPSDVWERLLVAGLARDFQQMRLEFLGRLVRRKAAKADPAGAVEKWLGDNSDSIRQFKSMIDRAQTQTPVAPAVLAQIASQARNLLDP
ncbi:MAG: NAD-glutamate dehydrogenase domain-containing protein [Pseudomonadota bacterium]